MTEPAFTYIKANRWGLVADRDDPTGKVKVVEVVSESPTHYWVFNPTPEPAGKIERRLIITRSEDKARMLTLKTVLERAWAESSVALDEARAKLEADFERANASDLLTDVGAVLDKVGASLAERRQNHWRQIIDHIAASPIDPVGGVQEAT